MDADGESGGTVPASAIIHIRCSNGSKFSVQAALDEMVGAFKAVVARSCDVPVEQQRLIYKGRILKDDHTLASYGVESDHTIHMVRGGAPSAVPTNKAVNNQGVSRATDTNPSSTFEGSLSPGLSVNGLSGSGTAGLLGAGFPELDQMQQQLSQNPNIMREIMNMPAMQNLISNPDIIRNLFMNNPQMREIIDRNPELAHVLNDPNTLRQTLEAARNPELMREMMRNTGLPSNRCLFCSGCQKFGGGRSRSRTMSYYNQQPPVGVPPAQGYPPEAYPKDAYPPPGYPPQGYPPAGYPQQGYPPAGYPQQGYPPPYAQQPPPRQQQSSGPSFAEGCLAALCCCCLLEACF